MEKNLNIKNKNKIIIIAEAGVNHNGIKKNIKKLIDLAANAKADYVKFQSFKADNLVTKNAKKAPYQKKLTAKNENQYQMLKKLEISKNDHKYIINYCKEKKINYLFTPFDYESLNILVEYGVKELKISSSDLNNFPFLEKIAKLNKIIFLSTGMSDIKIIKKALKILTTNGTSKKNIYLLHCNTDYPTNYTDVNLRAMLTMRNKFKIKVGYSDHTLGIEVPIAAATLGASVIEKHFTLDNNLVGPDHKASLNPKELFQMINSIRNIEKSLGDGIKKITKSEKKNIFAAKKSIYANQKINKGDLFTNDNLIIKRPGNGISPTQWFKIIGKKSKKKFNFNDLITLK